MTLTTDGKAGVCLDKQRWEKGKHTPRAKEAVYVGFADNMSAWLFCIPEGKKIMTLNKVKFSEHEFPFQKRKMMDQFLSDNSTDILYQHASGIIWVPCNKQHVGNYEKVHYDTMSDLDIHITSLFCKYKWSKGGVRRHHSLQTHYCSLAHVFCVLPCGAAYEIQVQEGMACVLSILAFSP